jgi:hypothetical protein
LPRYFSTKIIFPWKQTELQVDDKVYSKTSSKDELQGQDNGLVIRRQAVLKNPKFAADMLIGRTFD